MALFRCWFAIAVVLSVASCERTTIEILEQQGITASPESLICAARDGRARVVELLIDAGVVPDESRDRDGRSALMLAARGGNGRVVDLLCAASGDLDLADGQGMTALGHALSSGEFAIARKLLESGASADLDSYQGQPLLVTSVIRAQFPALQLLLEFGAKSGIDEALLIAAIEGKSEFVGELIRRGADPDTGAGFRLPVLNAALQNSDFESFRILLEAGADPNLRDDGAMSPLGYAVSAGDPELVGELLGKGADPDLPCRGEATAVEIAVERRDGAVLESLLCGGRAAIHPLVVTRAADGGSPETLAILLDHGARIDIPDRDGDTLLARAVRSGDAAQVHLLLRRGARADASCREGQSLLALATALKQPGCIAPLVAAGADPDAPLASPVSDAYRELVGSKTFTFYSRHDSRFTPIMVAASHGDADTVRTLLKCGASKNRCTRSYQRYPISLAAEAGHIEAQQLLVGYDPKEREDQFKIVISLSSQRAVMYKNGEVCRSSRVSTGKSGHRTPSGEFVITHKHRTWTSTLYHAPMPYFMRLSCKAFGTHVGYVPDYPASHGCIRMPESDAKSFFLEAPLGTPVSIVD